LALYSDDAGQLVGTRSLFPHSFSTAVRQKTRWTHGIALSGWARLGWPTSPGGDALDRLAGLWMLWRDRRTLVSALAILAGYTALVVTLAVAVIAPQSAQPTAADPILRLLAVLMTIILCWRLVMRALFSMRMHGWQQGLLAIPRLFISNIVLVACSWRALVNYLHELSGRPVVWDKTLHHFPATMAAKVPRA
jgi:adsorption protein B